MNAANKAWYWLAAGVLALGLNGYYQDGGFQGLHRVANGTSTAVVEAKSQLGQLATVAEVALAEHARCERPAPAVVVESPLAMPPDAPVRLAEWQERLGALQAARVQVQVARIQQMIARREMQRAEVELQNGHLAVLTNQGQVRVALPPLPPEIKVPQVNVEVSTN